MHMICLRPTMPIPASTEVTQFYCISCRKNLPHPFSAHPSCWRPEARAPCPFPAATDFASKYVEQAYMKILNRSLRLRSGISGHSWSFTLIVVVKYKQGEFKAIRVHRVYYMR